MKIIYILLGGHIKKIFNKLWILSILLKGPGVVPGSSLDEAKYFFM